MAKQAKKRTLGNPGLNYWYDARPNEMFLDLDSRRALRRAVTVLIVAIKEKRLPVLRMYVYPTVQRGHYHMIVVLRRTHNAVVTKTDFKWAWLLWMGNDRLRMSYVMARFCDPKMPHDLSVGGRFWFGDLLVSSKPYHREPDAYCRCEEKHKDDAVTRACPAMKKLLGEARSADYFARTGERRVKPLKVRVPWGEVSLATLKGWIRKGA